MARTNFGIGAKPQAKLMLGAVCGGRDNNLNVIRMIAATAVLVSHAYPLTLGDGDVEPVKNLLGRSLGSIAVAIFFVISGFLITRSFERRKDFCDWLAARVLRLMPALIVVVLLGAFVLGPLLSTLPADAYFGDPRVYTYIVRNITLASMQYELPGVFEGNPHPGAVNGSLWTLVHEAGCYVAVAVIGLLGLFRRPLLTTVLAMAYLGLFVLAGVLPFENYAPSKALAFLDLSAAFTIGILLYIWRDRIRLSFLACLALIAVCWLLRATPFYPLAMFLAISYVTFYLAFVPAGAVRAYNNLGDYSYGMYVFAFPVQQAAVYLLGDMGPLENVLVALPITLCLAVLSWKLVEKPSLDRKTAAARMLRRLFRRGEATGLDRAGALANERAQGE